MYEQNEPAQRRADGAARSGPSPTLIALVVIGVLAVVFILQNGAKTETNFLMFEFRSSLWVTILLAMAAGVVLDRLFAIWWRRRKRADD